MQKMSQAGDDSIFASGAGNYRGENVVLFMSIDIECNAGCGLEAYCG